MAGAQIYTHTYLDTLNAISVNVVPLSLRGFDLRVAFVQYPFLCSGRRSRRKILMEFSPHASVGLDKGQGVFHKESDLELLDVNIGMEWRVPLLLPFPNVFRS